eukprot:TRINITY_DN2282_c0_g2_i3.p1 TRINITY_DN2282_c0_g2~~TRINITY_DN2282_c0_g2_i3.p1  ORF type:complete len:314 (+),score=60.67 TRINITY_DN2282_c0_g2_i3:942-1883(+)
MKQECKPNEVGIQATKKLVELLTPIWPTLASKELLRYEASVLENVGQKSQLLGTIASGHEGTFLIRGENILKVPKRPELEFYRDLANPQSKYAGENATLKDLIPKFKGEETFNGKNYIVLQNLLRGLEKGSIVDFKLGKLTYFADSRPEKIARQIKKANKSTSSKLGFRISGFILKDGEGKISKRLLRSDVYSCVNEYNIDGWIRRILLSNDATAINPEILVGIINYLQRLIYWFENANTRQFICTSICLIIDNTVKKFRIALLDFAYVRPLPAGEARDTNTIEALHSLLHYFIDIQKVESEFKFMRRQVTMG